MSACHTWSDPVRHALIPIAAAIGGKVSMPTHEAHEDGCRFLFAWCRDIAGHGFKGYEAKKQ